MANNNYKSLDDLLNEKFSDVKPARVRRNEKPSKIKQAKKGKKTRIGVVIAALILALSTATTGIIYHIIKKKNSNENDNNKKNNTAVEMSIGDLGNELDFPEDDTKKYGETTGNVNLTEIVEKDGVYYNNQESADKSNNVGKTTTDTKNGTLTVDSTGKVKDKTTGYEVVDENNNVIASGDNKEDLLEDYITLDKNYYYKDGTLAFEKGSQVSKEDFNKYKDYLITDLNDKIEVEDEVIQETTKEETSNSVTASDEGVINADGTYTIFGLTFESKADYQQWVLQGYEGYAEVDGIMKSEESINEKQAQYTK